MELVDIANKHILSKSNCMVDLSPFYKEALNNIRTWKNRYSSDEYLYKVVLNMFYRRYTMKYMWNDIMSYANGMKGYKEFAQAYSELQKLYSQTATTKTHSVLEINFRNNPSEDVGGSSFDYYDALIKKAKIGNRKAKEEIEYCYFYFFLADQATLLWAAICATGVDKVRAIKEVSGFLIQPMPLNDFGTVSQGLGQLSVRHFLHNNYIPMP